MRWYHQHSGVRLMTPAYCAELFDANLDPLHHAVGSVA